jgi:hypothetical protein
MPAGEGEHVAPTSASKEALANVAELLGIAPALLLDRVVHRTMKACTCGRERNQP